MPCHRHIPHSQPPKHSCLKRLLWTPFKLRPRQDTSSIPSFLRHGGPKRYTVGAPNSLPLLQLRKRFQSVFARGMPAVSLVVHPFPAAEVVPECLGQEEDGRIPSSLPLTAAEVVPQRLGQGDDGGQPDGGVVVGGQAQREGALAPRLQLQLGRGGGLGGEGQRGREAVLLLAVAAVRHLAVGPHQLHGM